MPQPPLLPEETLARVLRLAKFDGMSVAVLGGAGALLSAYDGDVRFATIGLIVAGAGAVELHGAALLRAGEARGVRWLIASQPVLLAAIWAYCALRVMHFEMPPVPDQFRETLTRGAEQFGLTLEAYFQLMNRITAGIVAAVAAAYQGWMTIYYMRRRAAVERAVALPE
jgi:hypothetical protein